MRYWIAALKKSWLIYRHIGNTFLLQTPNKKKQQNLLNSLTASILPFYVFFI